ncbi:MFS transporter [Metallosphaera hakonensis]|uniref:MFS transporter n=2 Tax=Metallosphaera hakonensis TaxID=79601 RepID=A0A2U9IRC7_9CREN|nr:MFS transporter [Metallosphaera hakonensis]AWR98534.1 MFS transporter [Metallosphaera hakonensis JCM 8857 = DSM 7519]
MDSNPFSKNLDKFSWSRVHTYAFIAFSAGFFLEAYIFGMAPIASGWVSVPKFLTSTLLAWAPLWLIIGIIVTGPLSDRLGRKTMFYPTMSLYGIGALGLVFSDTYFLILLFLALMLFAAGGEMNTIMVATHEIMPSRHRSKAFFLELNFINIGGFVLGLIGYLVQNQSVGFQRLMIGVTVLIVLIILVYTRMKIPESIRWLEKQGKMEDAEKEVKKYFGEIKVISQDQLRPIVRVKRLPTSFKLAVVILVAAANTIGYGLMTYVLGPYFFSTQTPLIILVANLAEMLVGFVIGALADVLSRKLLLLISFIGATGSTFLIMGTIPEWSSSLPLFYSLLVVLNVFVGISYLTEDALKSEIWPTLKRGTVTAIARFISIGAYIPTIYLTSGFTIYQYMLFNGLVWAVGTVAAILWFLKGYETGKGVNIDEISGETEGTQVK